MKYSNKELIAKIEHLQKELQYQHKIINYSTDWEVLSIPTGKLNIFHRHVNG